MTNRKSWDARDRSKVGPEAKSRRPFFLENEKVIGGKRVGGARILSSGSGKPAGKA